MSRPRNSEAALAGAAPYRGSTVSGCRSDSTASPLLSGRALDCPLCRDAARYDPAASLLVCANPECPASHVLDEREVLEALESAGRAWWQSLPEFYRAVLSEPSAERAARRIVRDLLARGIAPGVVELIVVALNAQHKRPALRPALEAAMLAGLADFERLRGVAA